MTPGAGTRFRGIVVGLLIAGQGGIPAASAVPPEEPQRAVSATGPESIGPSVAAPAPSRPDTPSTGSRFRRPGSRLGEWRVIGSAVSLLAGVGVGVYLKSEADERFDRYLATADPAEAHRQFEDAQRFDRLSLIGWTVAQVSFVALFYFLTREEERPLVPVEGEPLLHAGPDGVRIGWRVAP